jgi:diguanylate cyclase (GGDEF)-like protein
MPLPPYQARSTIPALVILLGLAASLFTYSIVRNAEEAAEKARFSERAQQAAARLEDAIADECRILTLLRDLYRMAPPRDDIVLRAMTDGLFSGDKRDPSVAFIGWVKPVEPSEVAAYELDMRGQCRTFAEFTVHGPDGGPSLPRDEQLGDGYRHWVLDQVSPWRQGGRLHGLDLAADAQGHGHDAIREALQSGLLTVSRPLPLVDATHDSGDVAVLLVLPVFPPDDDQLAPDARPDSVRGVLVAALALQPLISRTFPERTTGNEPRMSFVIKENDVPLGTAGPEALSDADSATIPVTVANSPWTLTMSPVDPPHRSAVEWLDRTSVVLPPAIFVVMCLVSWIVWTQQRQTDVVRVQVRRQTSELRRQNVALETKEQELEEANRKLLELSNTDALTGILNRRAFEVQIDKERERSRRTDSAFGLLIFDIDHFKDYNDRYGHAAGDEVLRRVAQLMHNEARRIDSVARYGGEEFVILTAGIDAAGLMTLGERVRQRIQQATIENATSPHGVITVSGGGALSSAEGASDPRAIFDLADRCLYQAKSTGRNRVVMVM